MSKVFFIAGLVVLLSTGFVALKSEILFGKTSEDIVSPLPSYLTDSKLVRELGFWRPREKVMSSTIEKPNITAHAALVYDVATDTVLYEKESKKRLPVASLVKIATAIVALESKEPHARIRVSARAASIGENSMGITPGETYTLEELLYGLILHSGNDAAEAIAEAVSGESSDFVVEMNRKVKILGMNDTRFVNPSGLEGDGPSAGGDYSSAYDLVILTKHALTLPLFAKIAKTYEHHIPYATDHKELYLYNQTNLLTTYPGVAGVKTGYTPSAGFCLVTYVENGGHKLIGVILNSESRREEMRTLLDYSFTVLGIHVPGRT